MSKPLFVVPAADLERGPRSLSWVLEEDWLKGAFADTDAVPQGSGKLEVELSKNGREVMVRGHATAAVTLPCVVTLEPLTFELKPEIFLLLAPAPGATAPPRVARAAAKAVPVTRGGRPPPGGTPLKARKRPETEGGPEQELTSSDAARDTFDGERIVLDDFLREFLVLELPMYPRRSDLPSEQSPAIAPASPEAPASVDPRLLPLAMIASRLRDQKKE